MLLCVRQCTLYCDHLWAINSGLYREVVSIQRSVKKGLLGGNQLVFIERWSLDTGGLKDRFRCTFECI